MEAEIVYKQQNIESLQKKKNIGYIPFPFNITKVISAYQISTYHSRCIDVITSCVCSDIDFQYNDDSDIAGLEILENVMKTNNTSIFETIKKIVFDYVLFGNAFIEVVKDKRGNIVMFYHIPAQQCQLERKENTIYLNVDGVYFTPFGNSEVGKNEYIHIKKYNPISNYYGVPSYISLFPIIFMDELAVATNISYFQNHGVPSAVITYQGGELPEEVKNSIRDFFTQSYKGVMNYGRALLLTSEQQEAIKIQTFEQQNKDGMYRGLRADIRDEIIATHGVPRFLLGLKYTGDLSSGQKLTAEYRIFSLTIIKEIQTIIEKFLNNYIFKNYNVAINLKEIDVDDTKANTQFYSAMIAAGVLTPEEARKELGYDVNNEND